MITKGETIEIINGLKGLPPEKIAEVKDFVNFLQSQYQRSQSVDERDEWSDEDMREFMASSKFTEIITK